MQVLACDGPYNGQYVELDDNLELGDIIVTPDGNDKYVLAEWPVVTSVAEVVLLHVTEIDGEEHQINKYQKLVQVHNATPDCYDFGCCIHAPSDHSMKDFPLHWREDRGLMERICPHGVGHPDPDHLAFVARHMGAAEAAVEGVHGCDGCCGSMS